MPRPIQATIHLDALARNLERARVAAAGSRVWAVVKADGYGHGLSRVFPALRAADGFALLDPAEAATLRGLGWGGPILLIEGCFSAEDLEICERYNVWHVVHDAAQINWLAARRKPRAHRVFLKLNSGMNRLGFAQGQYRAAWHALRQLPTVADVGHMSHFACADVVGGTADAMAVFQAATDGLDGERTVCNSAALLRHAGDRTYTADWVRPGIMLYGSSPTGLEPGVADWDLSPAMTLQTRIIAVQELAAGAQVGYGALFRAPAPMRVGVAAVGYADGYPRHAPTGTPIVVDGVPTRTLGRVSMDMVAVDLEPVRAAGRAAACGSPVLCWGRADGAELSIDAVADAAGTLGYELMCALATRVPVRTEG